MNLAIEKLPEFDNHELVSFFYDKPTGLKGFISIYSTKLGPALGATRFLHYDNEEAGLKDSLRLAKCMAYKCALAGLPYGGAKGVIMADAKMTKNSKLIQAYAKIVSTFNGKFYTGQDVGMSSADVKLMAQNTKFVIGKLTNKSDNPPYWTAFGVFSATQAGLQEIYGKFNLKNIVFAVKGLGKVGTELSKLIMENGGQVIAADINPDAAKAAKKLLPTIKIVSSSEIHKQKVDVFAPCALGGCLNKKVVSELNCRLVCGGANNQLATPAEGVKLHRRKILYIPDYLANAGGLINVAAELRPSGYDKKWVESKCRQINVTTKKIIDLSKRSNRPTSEVADQLAEKILK